MMHVGHWMCILGHGRVFGSSVEFRSTWERLGLESEVLMLRAMPFTGS